MLDINLFHMLYEKFEGYIENNTVKEEVENAYKKQQLYMYELITLDGRDFIENLYKQLLCREADSEGLAAYLGVLLSGEKEKIDIIKEFYESEETKKNNIKIIDYDDYLYGYFKEEEIKKELINCKENIKPNDALIIKNKFVSIKEFDSVNGKEFIELAYKKILGREADEMGLNAYLASLQNKSKEEILIDMCFSPEGEKNQVFLLGVTSIDANLLMKYESKSFIEHLYVYILGREADEEGFEYYYQLLNHYPKYEILSFVINSEEAKLKGIEIKNYNKISKRIRRNNWKKKIPILKDIVSLQIQNEIQSNKLFISEEKNNFYYARQQENSTILDKIIVDNLEKMSIDSKKSCVLEKSLMNLTQSSNNNADDLKKEISKQYKALLKETNIGKRNIKELEAKILDLDQERNNDDLSNILLLESEINKFNEWKEKYEPVVDAINTNLLNFENNLNNIYANINDIDKKLSSNITETSNIGADSKQLNNTICELKNEINHFENDLEKICKTVDLSTSNVEDIRKELEESCDKINSTGESIQSMSRQIMYAKWKILDHLSEEKESDQDVLTCKICGFSQVRGNYVKKETKCIFNGGILIRYVCPKCGVIFGPTKFSDLTQQEIDEDYKVHYLGYSEGDSSYKEERAFQLLEPKKNKIYLNYGCGKWSHTLQKLRDEGYQVFGYEPYAIDTDNPYLITSRDELQRYRFDGIFSNDLLEHLINPVEELKFMSSLLIDENSMMSHNTSCYSYKYEYTRFHTHFFLGDSVKIMAEKAGLDIIGCIDDLEKNDFYCYLYRPKTIDKNIMDKMIMKRNASIENGQVKIAENGLICGPYLNVSEGNHSIKINAYAKKNEDLDCEYMITLNDGKEEIKKDKLKSGKNIIDFNISEFGNHFEIVLINHQPKVIVDEIELVK